MDITTEFANEGIRQADRLIAQCESLKTCETCLWWSWTTKECYSDNPGEDNCWTNPFDDEEREKAVKKKIN